MGYKACQNMAREGHETFFCYSSYVDKTPMITVKPSRVCSNTSDTRKVALTSLREKLRKLKENCGWNWTPVSIFSCRKAWPVGKPQIENVKSIWDYIEVILSIVNQVHLQCTKISPYSTLMY